MSLFRQMSGLGALLLAACAAETPSSLIVARDAYQHASDGLAVQLAPDQLHAAGIFLQTAERTYKDEGNSANMRDRAYVAMRKAQLAEAQAGIVAANLEVEQAKAELERAARQSHATAQMALQQTRAELASEREKVAAQSAEMESLRSLGQVQQESRGTVLTLSGSVVFASGKSELLDSAEARLKDVAAALTANDNPARIVVEGHTDSTGDPAMNQALSLKRAEAVRDALVSHGVAADGITVEGYGASRPIADNKSREGRANNRRVEIVIQPM